MNKTIPLRILHQFLNEFKNKEMHVKNKIDNFSNHNYWDQEYLENNHIIPV